MDLWRQAFQLERQGDYDVPIGTELLVFKEFSRMLHQDMIAAAFIDDANDPLKQTTDSIICHQYSELYWEAVAILNRMFAAAAKDRADPSVEYRPAAVMYYFEDFMQELRGR